MRWFIISFLLFFSNQVFSQISNHDIGIAHFGNPIISLNKDSIKFSQSDKYNIIQQMDKFCYSDDGSQIFFKQPFEDLFIVFDAKSGLKVQSFNYSEGSKTRYGRTVISKLLPAINFPYLENQKMETWLDADHKLILENKVQLAIKDTLGTIVKSINLPNVISTSIENYNKVIGSMDIPQANLSFQYKSPGDYLYINWTVGQAYLTTYDSTSMHLIYSLSQNKFLTPEDILKQQYPTSNIIYNGIGFIDGAVVFYHNQNSGDATDTTANYTILDLATNKLITRGQIITWYLNDERVVGVDKDAQKVFLKHSYYKDMRNVNDYKYSLYITSYPFNYKFRIVGNDKRDRYIDFFGLDKGDDFYKRSNVKNLDTDVKMDQKGKNLGYSCIFYHPDYGYYMSLTNLSVLDTSTSKVVSLIEQDRFKPFYDGDYSGKYKEIQAPINIVQKEKVVDEFPMDPDAEKYSIENNEFSNKYMVGVRTMMNLVGSNDTSSILSTMKYNNFKLGRPISRTDDGGILMTMIPNRENMNDYNVHKLSILLNGSNSYVKSVVYSSKSYFIISEYNNQFSRYGFKELEHQGGESSVRVFYRPSCTSTISQDGDLYKIGMFPRKN
ncbi:MAG: hypothetical protein M9958_01930 [Chitinophagales bacterium]|nr:hypothetical protein [Chitinophagales bacterium]